MNFCYSSPSNPLVKFDRLSISSGEISTNLNFAKKHIQPSGLSKKTLTLCFYLDQGRQTQKRGRPQLVACGPHCKVLKESHYSGKLHSHTSTNWQIGTKFPSLNKWQNFASWEYFLLRVIWLKVAGRRLDAPDLDTFD